MWLIYSILASMIWGFHYVMGELIYKKIYVITYIAVVCFCTSVVMFLISLLGGHLRKDFETILASKNLILLIIAGIFSFILAELLIGFSIKEKNAVLAGLIEISYPIFIVLFSFLIFKKSNLTLPILIGSLLIFAGISIISYFST